MPSRSKSQHNFFEMISHSKEMSKKTGVPQSVADEFVEAGQSVKHFKKTKIQKMYKDTK